nr:unnamed protein product [Callosobruchus chinensis]
MEDSAGISDSENDGFFFETDHLALRGDKDYCDVLKTVVTLTAFRQKVIQDYNKIIDIKKQLLEADPNYIIRKIQSGEGLGLDIPDRLEIPKLPVINFDKFQIKVQEADLQAIYSSGDKSDEIKEIFNSTANTKAWTPEEQKKLEELLILYPPEPIEMNRFKKIADALGTRTVAQVSSRVQKYFLKLYKAGLPIPGRIPKGGEKYKKTMKHYSCNYMRNDQQLLKPSTFFPEMITPVVMDDLEHVPGPTNCSSPNSTSSNYLLQHNYHQGTEVEPVKSETEMQLILLKRIRAEKLKEQDSSFSLVKHVGFKCDYCNLEPIVGARWHCLTCLDSVDFCTDCVLAQMYSSEPHPYNHNLAIFQIDLEKGDEFSSDVKQETIPKKSTSVSDDDEDVRGFRENGGEIVDFCLADN